MHGRSRFIMTRSERKTWSRKGSLFIRYTQVQCSSAQVLHMSIAHVYIVRHGETAENRQGIIQGHLDTQLNAIGEEQATLVADALKLVPFDIAYSSDLSRAAKASLQSFRLILVRLCMVLDRRDDTHPPPECKASETARAERAGMALNILVSFVGYLTLRARTWGTCKATPYRRVSEQLSWLTTQSSMERLSKPER